DYHNIHEKRRPNTIILSNAKHMAICICKQVLDYALIPIIFNNLSVHNLFTNEQLAIDTFDQIELLMIHYYDDAIAERKEEHSMKG
ncbi:1962_t:CDS:2, partial [Funneliformis caledonium]